MSVLVRAIDATTARARLASLEPQPDISIR
jgi:hypothetical protein